MVGREALWTVTLGLLMTFGRVQCQEEPGWAETSTSKIDGILDSGDASSTTENEIPVFPSTSPSTTTLTTLLTARVRNQAATVFGLNGRLNLRNQNSVEQGSSHEETKIRHAGGQRRNLRLLKFLRHFRLDFSKFDSTCMRRAGRNLPAPPVTNAHVFRYTRRRNRSGRQNRYAMVLYECNDGFTFPPESADRMFCSRNKWVGPTPVCLPKGSIHETECGKCEQICSVDANRDGAPVLCSCYAGYEMLNGTCVDVDECLTGNGGCSGICYNKPGSFQCFCPSGFQVGPDGKNCIDRNECLLRNGHGPCQDSCTNTIGAYTCSCERIPGTKLSADKHSCEDVNECEEETRFGCSHTCINTFGTAFCSCPKGYILSTTDYKTCSPEDGIPTIENLLEVPNPGILNTGVECPPGSEPDVENPQICVEHEDCTVENGGCDHLCIPSGSFRFCSCRPGYELLNETTCRDINECELENGGCDQKCVNRPGGHACACKKGYRLEEDERTCKAKYCDEPPTVSQFATWDCVQLDGKDVGSNERPEIGTQCKLRCLPGYELASQQQTGSRTEYEYLNTEPQAYQVVRYDIVTRAEVEGVKQDQITCGSDGNWSPRELLHTPATAPCIPSHCAKLAEPENGSVFPESCVQDGVPLSTQCLVLCSSGFYPKNGKIRTCSKGLRWFPEDNPACIRLPPTPRPYIHCPSDVVVDLKPGKASAYAKIPQPQANMDWFRYVEADPPWAKNLEWEVPAGVTQVAFTARSPVSNDTATCHFKIHVVDREAPRVQGCPTSFEIRLSNGESSREVWWSEPKFSDNVKLHYVQQTHSPGHLLSRGTHHISYIAGDAEANKARCSFTISVHSSDEYELADLSYYSNDIGRHVIICPNMKTGRWSLHYAYHLPPGCRYHSQGLFSKLFKQNTLQHFPARVSRRARMLRRS